MHLLLKLVIYATLVSGIRPNCDVCQASNHVACHSRNRYSLCINGKATEDYITCPKKHICTSDVLVCYPQENTTPSCKRNDINPSPDYGELCGICDEYQVFACINETTIAFCFGANEPLKDVLSYCPENTVCVINNKLGFCSDSTLVKPSCIPTDTPITTTTTTTTTQRTTTKTTDGTTTTSLKPTIKTTEPDTTIPESTATSPLGSTTPTIDPTTTTTTEESTTTTRSTARPPTTTTLEPTPTSPDPTTTVTLGPTTTKIEPTSTTTKPTATPEPPTTTTLEPTTMSPDPTTTVTLGPTTTKDEPTTTTVEPTMTTFDPTTTVTLVPTTTTTLEPYTTTAEPTTTTTAAPEGPRDPNKICQDANSTGFYKADDDLTCTRFVVCYIIDGTLYGLEKSCSNGQYFDAEKRICTNDKPAECLIEMGTTNPTPSTPSTTTPSIPREPNQICQDENSTGAYRADNDVTCTKFVFCYIMGGKLYGLPKSCPSGEYFQPERKVCAIEKPDGCP